MANSQHTIYVALRVWTTDKRQTRDDVVDELEPTLDTLTFDVDDSVYGVDVEAMAHSLTELQVNLRENRRARREAEARRSGG